MPLMSKPIRGIHGGPTQLDTGASQSMSGRMTCGMEMSGGRAPMLAEAWGSLSGGSKVWGSHDEEEDSVFTRCCLPSGCPRADDDPIFLADPVDAVKVVCNNERCREGQWMHADCFEGWEEHILAYLRSCGRARSWSEKQRHQNLWTKKGYDLAFKVCDCKCGSGHLRYDLSYAQSSLGSKSDEERRQKKAKRQRLPSIGNSNGYQTASNTGSGHENRSPLRIQRSSFSSNGSWSGSSPPSSTGTTPGTPPGHYMPSSRKNSFDFNLDPDHATTGNIFRHRTDLEIFHSLPHCSQNTYHIKTEDEGPHGNDEIRCLVLTSLSTVHATTVRCVVCFCDMQVYDKYPLIDGTFFLSPVPYTGTPEDLRVSDHHHRMGGAKGGGGLHLNAVCMRCMEGKASTLACRACRTPWHGASLVIGTMYAYDVFAAVPCCAVRLSCNRCRQPLLDPASGFKFFSDYSRLFRCPCCGAEDYHFVKPIEDIFSVARRW